ncbi:hypothetical protein R5R35_006005 [Gryllus longicercus]|uniref:Uncharacterized protein n=1 Tax=Gryllus longicercus TaxID=2509291 RepID=A0AAN9VK75_9ORTH
MGDDLPASPRLAPRVPPQTYRWEDLRRIRAQGGYPWTHLTKPPFSDSWEDVSDHEYEPISPPPVPQAARLAMDPDVETELGSPRGPFARTDSDEKRERRYLRIPLDDELVMMPGDGDAEDAAMRSRELGDLNGTHDDEEEEAVAAAAAATAAAAAAAAAADEEDAELSAQEMQARMEERYFAATPTTTESRTDCDVNTSQLDSSGLEDLPLKRDARKKKSSPDATAEKQSQARGLQQRIRSQAGRIRTKLRSMSRPKFSMPERPKFNLPERPKFSMPSMPERPKFHLPERPKFNLPERPKFNLPERPKFSFPERPKFHLPERPKFNLPERPKFNLPQRPKLSMPTLSSLSRSSASSTHEKKKGTSSTRRPLRDRPSTLSSGSSSTKRTLFDFDLRTYPRIFDRKAKQADYATSSPKATRAQTPPPKMPSRRKGPVGSRWVHRFTDIKYADDENVPPKDLADEDVRMDISAEDLGAFEERPGSAHTESTTAFRDKDYGYAVTMEARPDQPAPAAAPESIPESDREQRSSGSSSDRRRAGVLEEIDSDEFFLREKGLSQEDVDVGRYLTSEIRDAFRSPVSALSQMDKYEYYDEEDVENLGQRYRGTPEREPTRPARTRSLRPRKRENRTQKTPSPTLEKDANFYNTFPPARPKRARRQIKAAADDQDEKEQLEENVDGEGEIVHEYAEKMDDLEADAEVEAVGLGDASPAVLKRASPAIEEDLMDDELAGEADEEPRSEQWSAAAQHEDLPSGEFPPLAPKRKHRSRRELQEDDVVLNGHYTKEDWLENVEAEIEVEEPRGEPDYIIPASPEEEGEAVPVPPKRGRRHGSRGASLADEDRTSRGASSLPSEREPSEHELAAAAALEAALDAAGGYASVDKQQQQQQPPRPERPRRPKPPRPPPPGRRRRSTGGPRLTTNDVSHFFSLPRRAIRAPPVRPVRNYSTLGPARPPRRRAPEHEYEQEQEQERKSAAYMEIEDAEARLRREEAEDAHGSARDLQSGDVIEKMKTRPLPPPPRPPRKAREAAETSLEAEESLLEERLVGVSAAAQPLGALSDAVFYARQEETAPFSQIEEDAHAAAMRELRELRALRDELAVGDAPLAAELDLELEEVSVATQTDPLPDDVCVEPDEPHEPHPMADASTETYPAKLEMSEIKRTVIEAPPPPPPPEPIVVEKPVPYYVMPDPDTEVELKAQRLQVSELDVERLNVGELQAQKILVSDIDGMTMQVAELSSKSGHLVVSGIELPSGFLQELVDSRVAAATPPAPAAPAPVPAPSLAPAPASSPAPSVEPTVQKSTASALQDSVLTSSPEIACESQAPSAAPVPTPAAAAAAPAPAAAAAPLAAPDAATAAAAAQIAAQLSAPFYLSHALHSLQGAPPEVLHSIIPEYFASLPRPSSRTRAYPASQRDLESEEEGAVSIPPSSRRRRHARPPAQRYSSDEEEEVAGADHPPPSRRPPRVAAQATAQAAAHAAPTAAPSAPAASQALALPADASVVELGRQLVQACHAVLLRAIRHTLQYANSQLHDQEDKRRDLQVALCLLLVLVAGLILLGCFGSGQQHHHHWDFFFPPSR